MPDSKAGKKIKVFYAIERLARAGTELHLLRVLRQLDRTRFEPVLCCLNQSMCETDLIPTDLTVHTFDARWNLLHPSTIGIYWRLLHAIRQEKPDVIHSFLFVANILGAFASRRAGVRVFVASRGRMGIEWDANFLHRKMQCLADRRTDHILCKTEAMRQEIARHECVPLEKIRVIPNGVDTSHFRFESGGAAEARERLAQEFGIPTDGPLVLAVSNLKPIKGHRTLVEAAAKVREHCPALRVAIVGKGESEDELRDAVRSLGLETTVYLPGNAEDVRPWMRGADLFVAASLSEGMPNALLEAMAMGLPAVLSDIPGHRETAEDDAWYFPVKDIASLAATLEHALAASEERAERAQKGLERVCSSLSLEAMVRKIENVYIETLDAKS